MTEMEKLEKGLKKLGIPYQKRKIFDGEQIVCGDWDVICHSFSYGGQFGLLEAMGNSIVGEDYKDDVEGFLTASKILKRLTNNANYDK